MTLSEALYWWTFAAVPLATYGIGRRYRRGAVMSTADVIDTAELGSCDICGVSYVLGSDDHNGDTGTCWECDHGCEPVPAGVVFYRAQWVNEPRARCETCGHVWAYWDCACELVHDCDRGAP